MNTAILSGCTLQAILQSLAAGALCYAVLLMLLRLFPKLSEQGKYLLCNGVLLLLALSFLEPFLRPLLQSGATTKIILQQPGAHARHGVSAPAGPAAFTERTATLQAEAFGFFDRHPELVFQLYTIGLSVFLLRLVLGYAASVRLRHAGTSPADSFWREQLKRAGSKLGLQKELRLKFSTLVESPCILGWTKALVLIPVSLATCLSPEQAEAVLLHELGHFRLYHSWINLAAQVVISFLFFNPFAWLIQSLGNRHREYASDALTIRHSLQLALAESLLIIAAGRRPANPLSLSLLGRKNQLSHRIQNLLQMKPKSQNIRPVLIACGIAALIACTGYHQLSALPRKKSERDTLQAISLKMQSENNLNFLLVEALRDSLLRFGRQYEFKYQAGKIFIDGRQLPEPAQHRYLSMFRSIEAHKQASMWSVRGDSIGVADVLDPRSSLRKQIEPVKAHMPGARPAPGRDELQAAATEPAQAVPSGNTTRLVQAFIDGGIVDTLDPLFVSYENGNLFVNGYELNGKRKARYAQLLKELQGFEPDANGANRLQIYPEGVMPPSSSSGNTDMRFPRNGLQKPYVFTNSRKAEADYHTAIEALKTALVADKLANPDYTIHVEYSTKGIFVNNRKISSDKHEKYERILTEEFNHKKPRLKSDLLDMTF